MADPTFFSGLIRNDEDRRWLANNGRKFGGSYQSLDYPKELDPRPIVRVEDQGNRNSCVGHGLSSCGEICAWIDSGGVLEIEFSRWGAYIWSQQMGGMAGRDNGATISGAIKAAAEIGFCPESLWPYPPSNAGYSTKEPAGVRQAAAPYLLMAHTNPNNYAQGFEWINQGKGPLLIGVDWTQGLANNTGDVTLADVRGRSLGGHCMFLWGWDADGLLYLGNSHTEGWGQRGWRKVRPEVVDYWCQRGDVYAMSDLKDVKESRAIIVDPGEGM